MSDRGETPGENPPCVAMCGARLFTGAECNFSQWTKNMEGAAGDDKQASA